MTTMTKREFERRHQLLRTLQALGFTFDEAESLRRISNTLQRWHELECGTEHGYIQRENDDGTGRPFWYHESIGKRGRFPIADREAGAKKRLTAILARRNGEHKAVCPNCQQWQHAGNDGDCFHECAKRGFAKASGPVSAYIQTDPRGAALYILRPGDVPAGADVSAYYTRGICVY